MLRFCYRVLQHVMVIEGVAVLVGDTAAIVGYGGRGATVRSLDCDDLDRFIAAGHAPHCQSLVERLYDERLHCYGSIDNDQLTSFCWFHRGGADASMNEGYCPATGTAIELTEDAAFVLHAYTAPQARGRGLLPQVLSAAARDLKGRFGLSHLVGTTELTNDAAIAAFRRAGFDLTTSYWRIGIGRWAAGWYPRPVPPVVRYGG